MRLPLSCRRRRKQAKAGKSPDRGRGRRRALTRALEGPLDEGPQHRPELVVAEAGQSAGAAGFRLAESAAPRGGGRGGLQASDKGRSRRGQHRHQLQQ